MKFNKILMMLLAILAASVVVSAQDASIQQLKQTMEKSAENLTTYTYSRSAEANATLYKRFHS